MKYDLNNVKNYLELVHPKLMKSYLWTWIFMASFFGIIPAISDPFIPWFYYCILTLVIFLDAWALLILTDMYKWQKMYILFIGVYSLIMSLIFIMISFKFIYSIVGVQSLLFAVYSLLIYLLIFIIGFRFHVKALKIGYYSSKIEKGRKGISLIVFFAILGTIIGKFLIKTTKEQTTMVIFALVFLLFGYMLELGINNIHKYYLMNLYKDYIKIYDKVKTKKNKKN